MIGSVRIRKKSGKSLELELREFLIPLNQRHMLVLSEETVKEIHKQISDSLVRPGSTGNLMNSFFAEKTMTGYGVGNISYLNQNAKQWFWLNYGVAQSGRTTPPNVIGAFSPGERAPMASEFRNGRFSNEINRTDVYLLSPNKAIEAKNYIEKTLAVMFAKNPSILAGIK